MDSRIRDVFDLLTQTIIKTSYKLPGNCIATY